MDRPQYLSMLRLNLSLLVSLFIVSTLSQFRVGSAQVPSGRVTPVRAQTLASVNVKHFRPTTDALSLITVERAVALEHLKLNLSLLIDSERDSLSFNTSSGEVYAALEQVTTGQFSVTLGLWSRLNIGISLPLHILKSDIDGPQGAGSISSDGVGDASLSVKGVIFDSIEYPIGVALLVHTYWAIAPDALTLLSDAETPLIEPWLIVDSEWRWATLALNVGYRARSEHTINPLSAEGERGLSPVSDPVSLGSELVYRVGLSLHYVPQFFHHCFEVTGGQPVGVTGANRAQRLEILSGFKLIFNRGSYLTFGGGRGILDGYSQPAWRAFMGITFHPTSSDQDLDGLIDERDRCPREAEDFDGFKDQDGCPDLDNDGDGFLDIYDACPNEPEDDNGFEDTDGCPDARQDLDRDGILDSEDECPREPEDKDQFQDTDGCPDPDNDLDRIPDRVDRCPNESEDYDNFEDKDGCPDRDNDGDKIPDDRDRCPTIPEDLDGDSDEDGCPERDSARVTDQGSKLSIAGKVFFDVNQARIKSDSHSLLLEISAFLNDRPQIKQIEVQGHTDQRGRRAYNIELSEQRAAAVRRFLIQEGGVSAERLKSRGYGPDQPINSANTARAHAQNRRVEFVVLERE